MASNSYTSMLSLLQMWLKNQDAAEKRQHDLEMQRQKQQEQQQGDQQSSPMDAYNQYTQISDMLAAPASGSIAPSGTGAGGLFGTPATISQPAGTGLYGTTSTLSAPAGEGLFGTGVGSTTTGTGAGASAGTGAGGMATAAAPYAALAGALAAFKLNDDWMSKGAGKTFGGEMQSAWDESFGNHGMWGLLKGLFK